VSTLIGRRVTVGRSALLAVNGHRQFSGQQAGNANPGEWGFKTTGFKSDKRDKSVHFTVFGSGMI